MQAERNNTVSNQHLMQLMDSLGELVMVLRLDGTCAWCNSAFAEFLGKPRETMLGKAYPLPELRELMVTEPPITIETWVDEGEKGIRLIRLNAVPGFDFEGCVESILITGSDMTPLYRLHHPLHLACNNVLLPVTAPQIVSRIEHALQLGQRAEEYVVFLALQITGADLTVDESGYRASLERISTALQQKIRQGDTFARLDSGAYLLVLEQMDCPEAIAAVVDKLSAALIQHQPEGLHVLAVNIGVAVNPDDGAEPMELIDRAQQAMQRAIMNDEKVCYF